jgi:2-dehydropantoate 2-reductase
MKILIIGPGAMGLLFSSFLKKAGQEVFLLDKREERAKVISKNGIEVTGISGDFKVNIPCSINPSDFPPPDVIMIAVKSYDTKSAIKTCVPVINEDALILSLQNGIGNLEKIAKFISEEKILGGVTSQGATLLGVGKVKHAGQGDTVIGPFKEENFEKIRERLEGIVQIFNKADIETKISKKVDSLLWSKLIINVGINALTAITKLKNGMLPKIDTLKEIMREAVEEAIMIADKKGIEILYPNPQKQVELVCEKTADNISSMLQDILRGKKTEIDSINGAVVREAEKLGIATSVNSFLTKLVKAIEESSKNRITSL